MNKQEKTEIIRGFMNKQEKTENVKMILKTLEYMIEELIPENDDSCLLQTASMDLIKHVISVYEETEEKYI